MLDTLGIPGAGVVGVNVMDLRQQHVLHQKVGSPKRFGAGGGFVLGNQSLVFGFRFPGNVLT